jgi:hypothetical protein
MHRTFPLEKEEKKEGEEYNPRSHLCFKCLFGLSNVSIGTLLIIKMALNLTYLIVLYLRTKCFCKLLIDLSSSYLTRQRQRTYSVNLLLCYSCLIISILILSENKSEFTK